MRRTGAARRGGSPAWARLCGWAAAVSACMQAAKAAGPPGTASGPWTAAMLTEHTEVGNPYKCYAALFLGRACQSAGAVYRIDPQWYTQHSGGSFATKGTCGSVVESWARRSRGHFPFARSIHLGESIRVAGAAGTGIAAHVVANFTCVRAATPPSAETGARSSTAAAGTPAASDTPSTVTGAATTPLARAARTLGLASNSSATTNALTASARSCGELGLVFNRHAEALHFTTQCAFSTFDGECVKVRPHVPVHVHACGMHVHMHACPHAWVRGCVCACACACACTSFWHRLSATVTQKTVYLSTHDQSQHGCCHTQPHARARARGAHPVLTRCSTRC